MKDPLSDVVTNRGWPLCRAYSLALFEAIDVELEESAGVRSDQLLIWALGVLPGGEQQFLGQWLEHQHGVPWEHLPVELRVRGAEQIRLVVGPDRIGISAAMQTSFPGATVLIQPALFASDRTGDPEPFHALPSRCRRLLDDAKDAAHRLGRSLERALVRHGSFPTPEVATIFFVDWLARAQRKRDRAELAMAVAAHRCFLRSRASTASGVGLAGRSAP